MKRIPLILLFLLTCTLMSAQNKTDIEKTISVNASAKVDVAPDQAVIRININEKGKTFDEATNKLNDIIAEAKRLLDKENIDADDIKTKSYNIYKNYRYHNGKQLEDGYMGNTYIEAKIPLDTKKLSSIIKRFAENSNGLNLNFGFEISDELMEQTKEQLLVKAVKRARSKADAIASALGKEISDVKSVNFSENNHTPYQRNMMYAEAAMDSMESKAAAPIQNVDDIKMTLNVQTIWLLN